MQITQHDPARPITGLAGRRFGGNVRSIRGVSALCFEGCRCSLLGGDGSVAVFQLARHADTGAEAWFVARTLPAP
jgi:hypothetical protein